MSLKDKLAEDFTEAMRGRQELRLSTLRMLRAGIKNAEVARGRPLDDGEVLEVIAKQIKEREDSIEQFQKAQRSDLAEKEQREMDILKVYMPEQMSREEIVVAAEKIIAETGARGPQDKGKVMPVIMGQLRGRAGGRDINEVVTELLSRPVQS